MATFEATIENPLCHDDESFALLQFKESFIINQSASHAPPAYPKLSKLTYLNLSESAFSGQIPSALLQLSELVSLDLSSNPLSLQSPGLRGLAEKLTNLEQLHLVGVNISSTVPNSFANLTSLTSLLLEDCDLHDLGSNPDLSGRIPEFNRSFPLEYLSVKSTSFSGELPNSIDNLKSLSTFDVGFCHFSGSVPPSLGNLTELIELHLKFNNFKPWTLSWLHKQTKLIILDVAKANLYGNIPFSLVNLTQVRFLQLWSNKLTGPFPSWLANLTHLTDLALGANELHGPITTSISNLVNLQSLTLHSNHLSGTVEFDLFYNLKNLTDLELSVSNLSLLVRSNTTTSREKFKVLGLSFCGLSDFPDFLRSEDELEYLVLSQNKIHGQIPKWMWSLSKDTLQCLEMSNNFLTGFEQAPDFPPWTNLRVLDLSRNELQGSLPVPPPSIYVYYITNNMFSGEISPMFCNLSLLSILEISYKNLSGFLPGCLGNLNDILILSLQGSNFHGSIPQMFMRGSKLRMKNLNQNHLRGSMPRSLLNCTKLEILDLGKNYINDTFPSWFGILPELRVLILRSNGFHGVIGEPLSNFESPKLQILDFSNNSFKGSIPSSLVNLTNLESLDLSLNKFSGEIPLQLAELNFLTFLNVSHNRLTGCIPQGKEIVTFENNSFDEHIGLCGSPLSKKCGHVGNSSLPPSTFEEKQSSKSPIEFGWKVVVVGYGCGLIVGVLIGQIVITRKIDWFIKTFAVDQPTRRLVNWKGRRNYIQFSKIFL
nr:receptor-like protein kinase [Quercus suber]